MTQSFLPKPLLYKEWKEHKWWVFAGVILLLHSPVLDFLSALLRPPLQGVKQGMIWQVIFPVIYHFQFTLTSSYPYYPSDYLIKGPPTLDTIAAVVAMGLMISLVSVERSRGSMWYTFSFPIRRIDMLRVKIGIALCAVLGSLMVNFIVLVIADILAKQVIPLSSVILWLFENALLEVSLMAVGLAAASVITTGLLAGLTALLVSATPWALGSAVLPQTAPGIAPALTQTAPFVQGTSMAGHISMFLRGLSPLHYSLAGMTQTSGPQNSFVPLAIPPGLHLSMSWWAVTWLILWTVAWGALGVYGYLRAKLEHVSNLLQFPKLLPFVLWLLYGFVSSVAANALTIHHNQTASKPYVLLIHWLLMWIVIGMAGTVFRYFFRRERQTPSA
ncbi:hypothetical protein [Alicyclobacillus sp. SO9]|uniref:hypothetical protein n=1 Tax=Alicyclobacillus sp. SO9 TaxID=2665646 RepID=UPI0018E76B21|nr:hypothetical protein [Alicyclobacillus sp. SO9]QQE79873.1 hypothetical protein GI364_05150 [Alicyclobacillus sp. SO9]